jgi:hypothetical protein
VQLLNSLLVVSQILLTADKDDGQAGAEVENLGDPLEKNSLVSRCPTSRSVTHDAIAPWARERVIYLLLDVVQWIRRVDGEADEDDMWVGVRKRSETVVVFLASSIPER